MKEKRLLPRMNVATHYQIIELDSAENPGRVMDLTTDGMRLRSPEPFETNTTGVFEMIIPQEDNASDSLLFDANVIWSRESSTPRMYDTGIRVWSISIDDSDYLQQIVDDIPIERQPLVDHLLRPFRY
jgi:hypothetical protein